MDLDDLKQSWDEQDKTLDATLTLRSYRLHAAALGKAETAMKRLTWMLWLELLLNIGAALCTGSFIADHVTEPRFLLPAAVLHLFVIALLGSGIYQLVAIGNLDFDAPVLAIQKRLESLRYQRLLATMLTLLASPLLWIPMLIVAMKGLLGLDAYAILPTDWLIGNVVFGLAVIPLAIWIARRYADRMERSPLAQRLLRDLAGYNLNAAARFLSRVAEFEEEEQTA
jgi:serine/threonine-protein kinase